MYITVEKWYSFLEIIAGEHTGFYQGLHKSIGMSFRGASEMFSWCSRSYDLIHEVFFKGSQGQSRKLALKLEMEVCWLIYRPHFSWIYFKCVILNHYAQDRDWHLRAGVPTGWGKLGKLEEGQKVLSGWKSWKNVLFLKNFSGKSWKY